MSAAERQPEATDTPDEAMRPDIERVQAFAAAIRALKLPEVTSKEARAALASAEFDLSVTADELEAFQARSVA